MSSSSTVLRVEPRQESSPLRRHVLHVDAILAGLDTPLSQIDVSFVSVGDELVACAATLAEVTAHLEALPKDLESTEVVEATERLSGVIRHAREIARRFDAEERDLDGLIDRVSAAKGPMASLRKTIRMIGIVAFNAHVVAAGIEGESDQLSVFTHDVADLSRKAAGTIERFFSAYEALSRDLHKTAADRAVFQTSQQGALEEAASRLSGSLADLTERRRRAADSSIATSRLTRDIGVRLGRTVMNMQVGDSTRQRVEHVVAALCDVRMLALGGLPSGLASSEPPEPQDIVALLELLQAQTDAALADFEAGIVDAETSMAVLSQDVDDLMRQSKDLYERKDRQGESALGKLGADLHAVTAMLAACETDRQKLDAVAATVGDMVAELLGHVEAVQEIESNMRLVTLNAAVRCAKLGPRGKALNVIAKHLRELTGDMVASAELALSVLREAADRARDVVASADGVASEGISRLIADADAAIRLFETVDDRLSFALKLLHSQECDCNNRVERAVTQFAGRSAISECLADASIGIAGLAGEISTGLEYNASPGPAGLALFARVRGNYSMDSERLVHGKIAGVEPVDPGSEPQNSAVDEDDLGLF